MTEPIHGGCLCGAIRYELLAAPQRVDNCHCQDCRRAAAAPFVTWGGVRRESLRLRMDRTPSTVVFAGRTRHFAPCCGTPLFFEACANSEWIDVTICSLDEPANHAPGFSIWTEDRLPWITTDPQQPVYLRGSPPSS